MLLKSGMAIILKQTVCVLLVRPTLGICSQPYSGTQTTIGLLIAMSNVLSSSIERH